VIEANLSLARLRERHRRIAIDSDVLIYLLEGSGERADRAAEIVDAFEEGAVVAFMSAVGLTEILTGPSRVGDTVRFESLAQEIGALRLTIVACDAPVAEDAAWLRGAHGMATPDAIHLASARSARATLFITNDRRIRAVSHLEVVYLDDLAA